MHPPGSGTSSFPTPCSMRMVSIRSWPLGRRISMRTSRTSAVRSGVVFRGMMPPGTPCRRSTRSFSGRRSTVARPSLSTTPGAIRSGRSSSRKWRTDAHSEQYNDKQNLTAAPADCDGDPPRHLQGPAINGRVYLVNRSGWPLRESRLRRRHRVVPPTTTRIRESTSISEPLTTSTPTRSGHGDSTRHRDGLHAGTSGRHAIILIVGTLTLISYRGIANDARSRRQSRTWPTFSTSQGPRPSATAITRPCPRPRTPRRRADHRGGRRSGERRDLPLVRQWL